MKNIRVFLSETISVFGGEIFYKFEQACFCNVFENIILQISVDSVARYTAVLEQTQ